MISYSTCPAGLHEMTPENTIVRQYKTKPTARDCRACEQDYNRKRKREYMARARGSEVVRDTKQKRFDYSDQPWYRDYEAARKRILRREAVAREQARSHMHDDGGDERPWHRTNSIMRIDYDDLYIARFPAA